MPTEHLCIYTIGHSTRTIEQFIALLKEYHIELLVDVRSFPCSRRHPQFNEKELAKSLSKASIRYLRLGALGGYRGKSTLSPNVNGLWRHPSFHNYADYALSDEFGEGLQTLIDLGWKQTTCIMCSEAVWWRCHRRIITDYLIGNGVEVVHIMGPGQLQKGSLTKDAVVTRGKVTYPPIQRDLF